MDSETRDFGDVDFLHTKIVGGERKRGPGTELGAYCISDRRVSSGPGCGGAGVEI